MIRTSCDCSACTEPAQRSALESVVKQPRQTQTKISPRLLIPPHKLDPQWVCGQTVHNPPFSSRNLSHNFDSKQPPTTTDRYNYPRIVHSNTFSIGHHSQSATRYQIYGRHQSLRDRFRPTTWPIQTISNSTLKCLIFGCIREGSKIAQ